MPFVPLSTIDPVAQEEFDRLHALVSKCVPDLSLQSVPAQLAHHLQAVGVVTVMLVARVSHC